MKIRTKIIVAFLLLEIPIAITGLISIGGLSAIQKEVKQNIEKGVYEIQNTSHLNSTAQFIRYYDEVLTQSARNFAFTGDMYWKNRYEENAALLDQQIQEAIRLGDSIDKQTFARINEANTKLVQMEEKSMSLVMKKNQTEARKILDSQEYALQKNTYQKGLIEFSERKGTRYNTALSFSTNKLDDAIVLISKILSNSILLTSASLIFVAILALIVGIITAILVSRPIMKIVSATQEIIKGDYSKKVAINSQDEIGLLAKNFNEMTRVIQEARTNIENKVAEKTKELAQINSHMVGRELKMIELKQKIANVKQRKENSNEQETNDLVKGYSQKQYSHEDEQKALLNVLEDVEKEKRNATVEKIKYESLLTNIGDGVIVTDEKGDIILINKAGEDILGFQKAEILHKKFIDVISVVDVSGKKVPEKLRPIYIATHTGKPFMGGATNEYYYVGKEGKKIPVALSVSPVMVEKKLFGVIDVFRDITHEKDVDRMKSEFISLASHQLRTPLSTINWYCEMLLAGDAGPISDQQKKFLQEAYGGSQRMSKLVNALLNVSRIETGSYMVEPQKLDLIKLVKSVLEESHQYITEKKLTVELKNEKIPPMMLDQNLTTIILQNLITNAVKYSLPKEKVIISISKIKRGGEIASHKASIDSLSIQVKDAGIGIPKKQQEYVFNKLFRADNARKSDAEGTGLGLYLVKSLIEHSKGQIWFDSIEGKGTTFYVLFPLSGMEKKEGEKRLS